MNKSVSNQCFKDDIKALMYEFGSEVNLYVLLFTVYSNNAYTSCLATTMLFAYII